MLSPATDPVTSALDIPDTPDRIRASMKDKGVDALVLLGNGNVVYATGASWPLLDAGLSHVERPVAVVLADDEHPHLYMPFREGSAFDLWYGGVMGHGTVTSVPAPPNE